MARKCGACEKLAHSGRKEAKHFARVRGLQGLHVYRCPHGTGFHLGHLPSAVLRGEVSKNEYLDWDRARTRHRGYNVPRSVKNHLRELECNESLDILGASFATYIASYRTRTGRGPTWKETWTEGVKSIPPDELALFTDPPDSWPGKRWSWRSHIQEMVMVRLRQLGWVTFDGRERSLATGAKFRQPDKLSSSVIS